MENRIIHGAAFGQGQFPTIALVNLATVPLAGANDPASDFSKLAAALQKYADLFATIWGYPCKVIVCASLKDVPADAWPFLFIDDADTAGALGYHDLTKNGQPVGKIFVKTTITDGEKVSVTAAHELVEMLIDPGAQLYAQKDSKTLIAYETADPVEENVFEIDGIAMSNFVHPAYFENFPHPKGTKYDHLGLLTKPFSMTKGGYLIKMVSGKVSQQFGSKAKEKRFAKEHRLGHRSEHRKALAGQNASLIPPKRRKHNWRLKK